MDLADIDLMEDTWSTNVPHEAFATLRREAPVFWHELEGEKAPGFWATRMSAALSCTSGTALARNPAYRSLATRDTAASAEFRMHLARVLTERALIEASS